MHLSAMTPALDGATTAPALAPLQAPLEVQAHAASSPYLRRPRASVRPASSFSASQRAHPSFHKRRLRAWISRERGQPSARRPVPLRQRAEVAVLRRSREGLVGGARQVALAGPRRCLAGCHGARRIAQGVGRLSDCEEFSRCHPSGRPPSIGIELSTGTRVSSEEWARLGRTFSKKEPRSRVNLGGGGTGVWVPGLSGVQGAGVRVRLLRPTVRSHPPDPSREPRSVAFLANRGIVREPGRSPASMRPKAGSSGVEASRLSWTV
jgi:hypothetical protein